MTLGTRRNAFQNRNHGWMTDLPTSKVARPAPAGFRRHVPEDADTCMVKATDGWPLRTIRWTPPLGTPRGSILFLGGRGDHFEKYLESFEDWRLAGWQVESLDWRGQGGSGRLAHDPCVGHVHDFGQWIDDLARHYADWQARTPAPHVVIAHSMGGHLALRTLAEGRIAPDAAVLVAPMLGFTAPYPNWLGLLVARAMTKIGDPERGAWSVSEKPGSPLRLRRKLLTHDDSRYDDELWWKSQRPDLALGPASWRWVEQAYASFIGLAKSGQIEAIVTPVLILAASKDALVSASAIRKTAMRLTKGTLHIYGQEAAHELLREADNVRDDALARITSFLDQVAPRR